MRLFSFAGKQLASVDAAGLHNHMAAVSPDGRFFAAATFTSDVKVTCAMLSCMNMSILLATGYCEPLLGAPSTVSHSILLPLWIGHLLLHCVASAPPLLSYALKHWMCITLYRGA